MTKEQAYKIISEYYRETYDQHVKRFNGYLQNTARAEDIVSEAFYRACNYWESIPEDPEEFPKWFNQVLNNSSKNNSREEKMHGAVDYAEVEEVAIEASAIPKVIFNEVVERINDKEEDQTVILTMFLIQGYRMAEIAKVVPQSISAIKKVVQRFREEIKKEFRWSL